MPKASFEIKTTLDFYRAFQECVDDFLQDPTSSRKAITACMFAYHLPEWIWKEHKEVVIERLETESSIDFYDYAKERHPGLRTIREICNGSKHFIDRDGDKISSSGLTGRGISFPIEFPGTFEAGSLTVTIDEGQIMVTDLLSDVRDFYESLLIDLGLLS